MSRRDVLLWSGEDAGQKKRLVRVKERGKDLRLIIIIFLIIIGLVDFNSILILDGSNNHTLIKTSANENAKGRKELFKESIIHR